MAETALLGTGGPTTAGSWRWHAARGPRAARRTSTGGGSFSSAWIVGKDASGMVVATARAMSDDTKAAMVFDVAVAPGHRGRGLGQALMSVLLQHPRVRGARRVMLDTRDAQAFYAKLGFGPYRPRHDQLVAQEDPSGRLGRSPVRQRSSPSTARVSTSA